ncbi:hypothetical protein LXL04_016603 [Taraxacum kok-saghyz]
MVKISKASVAYLLANPSSSFFLFRTLTPPQRPTARSRIQCFPIAPIQRIQLHLHPPPHLTGPFPLISGVHNLRHSRFRHVKLSIPHFMTIQLISYHISPPKLTIRDMFDKPLHICISTRFQQQKISITKKDQKNRVLEINNVLIMHPDMFIQGPILPICAANRSDVSRGIAGAKSMNRQTVEHEKL